MSAIEITPRDLARQLENGHAVRLVDVRQSWENAIAHLAGSLLIPLGELPQRVGEIPCEPGMPLVLYCHHGVRSLSAVSYLHRLGYHHARSLAGGIDAWSCEVDPTVPRY
jgi:sulfur-carrier protein adenylyltransferase/sulfurtransferase